MIWLSLLVVPLVAAALGAFLAGAVASLAVGWYRITSREGASGYFVVFMGLLGLVAGLIIGVIACAIVRPETVSRLGLAVGVSVGVIVVLALIAAVTSRLLADVPPTIDGESLMLRLEVRQPVADTAASPAGPGSVALSAHSAAAPSANPYAARSGLSRPPALRSFTSALAHRDLHQPRQTTADDRLRNRRNRGLFPSPFPLSPAGNSSTGAIGFRNSRPGRSPRPAQIPFQNSEAVRTHSAGDRRRL